MNLMTLKRRNPDKGEEEPQAKRTRINIAEPIGEGSSPRPRLRKKTSPKRKVAKAKGTRRKVEMHVTNDVRETGDMNMEETGCGVCPGTTTRIQ